MRLALYHSLLPNWGWLRESERRRDSVLNYPTVVTPPSVMVVLKLRHRSVLSRRIVFASACVGSSKPIHADSSRGTYGYKRHLSHCHAWQ
jgi:hypothetical protein